MTNSKSYYNSNILDFTCFLLGRHINNNDDKTFDENIVRFSNSNRRNCTHAYLCRGQRVLYELGMAYISIYVTIYTFLD